ncbi:MAG: Fe(3+) ABC transporter substrate-binding protein [Hasllibacter sp.]
MRAPILAALAAATALPALAQVNIYSYRQPELIQPLLDAFTEETGIETRAVFLEDGMIERLQAEGPRSPADIILTVDISRLTGAKEAGVTQAVESEVLEAAIPPALRDPEGHWFGVTTRARVLYAANERVGDGEIATYEALADPEWRGRICTRSGTHAYTLALTAAMIETHGEDYAREWLRGVKDNLARAPEGNDRAQVRAIWAGECDVSLGNTYYMGAMLQDDEQREWAESVRILFPAFEEGGTHVNLSGVAMTAAAPNREDALRFMEFLVSETGQTLYAEAVYEYPVLDGVAPSDLVASWGAFTPDDAALAELGALRPDALRITQEVDFDG